MGPTTAMMGIRKTAMMGIRKIEATAAVSGAIKIVMMYARIVFMTAKYEGQSCLLTFGVSLPFDRSRSGLKEHGKGPLRFVDSGLLSATWRTIASG